jgi:hypothetical protein
MPKLHHLNRRRVTWQGEDGRIHQLDMTTRHARLGAEQIRKKFFSLRGIEERQTYLLFVMHEYPLQVVSSGLIAWFDGERACLKTSKKLEWLHRLPNHSNTARSAFDKLTQKQQDLVLLVFAEGKSVRLAAQALKVSRQHGYHLFWKAVDSVFSPNEDNRRSIRKIRDLLDVTMNPESSWREVSGYSEDALDHLDHCARKKRIGESGEDGEQGFRASQW